MQFEFNFLIIFFIFLNIFLEKKMEGGCKFKESTLTLSRNIIIFDTILISTVGITIINIVISIIFIIIITINFLSLLSSKSSSIKFHAHQFYRLFHFNHVNLNHIKFNCFSLNLINSKIALCRIADQSKKAILSFYFGQENSDGHKILI